MSRRALSKANRSPKYSSDNKIDSEQLQEGRWEQQQEAQQCGGLEFKRSCCFSLYCIAVAAVEKSHHHYYYCLCFLAAKVVLVLQYSWRVLSQHSLLLLRIASAKFKWNWKQNRGAISHSDERNQLLLQYFWLLENLTDTRLKIWFENKLKYSHPLASKFLFLPRQH